MTSSQILSLIYSLEAKDNYFGGFFLLVLLACFFTYAISRAYWEIQVRDHTSLKPKVPPTIPYALPFLGSILSIALNPKKFLHDSTWAFKTPNPFGFWLFGSKFFMLQGAQNIAAFWKMDSKMIGMTAQIFCLKYLFGMPDAALKMYTDDDSGFKDKPARQSKVSHEDRVDYHTHVSLLAFTRGKHFSGFYQRWYKSFDKRIQNLHGLDNWIEYPDLLKLFERDFALSVIEATCGTVLEQHNPNFAEDLATYARYTPTLSKGIPQFLAPKAYAIRDKLFANVKDWHKFAKQNFQPSSVEDDGDADPFWGSEFMRSRQRMFESFSGFDENAAAASDLGFIWALTYNIVPTVMWVILHIHKDPTLRSRIRNEFKEAGLHNDIRADDVKTIINLPRLQGVYAECLRLYDQGLIPRETTLEINVNGWKFPRNSTIIISTDVAQLDKTAWNTGLNGEHPVDQFWAERFLRYPDDPNSGPINSSSIIHAGRVGDDLDDPASKRNKNPLRPIFSESSTAGYWIPYGGGSRICPGRHFAKRSIMTAAAILTSLVDIEILANEEDMKMDSKGYGLAAQRPVGKIPCRIRRWRGGSG